MCDMESWYDDNPICFTTERDLRTWLDALMGQNATPELVDAAHETIHHDRNRPPYGTDWSRFLESYSVDDLFQLGVDND